MFGHPRSPAAGPARDDDAATWAALTQTQGRAAAEALAEACEDLDPEPVGTGVFEIEDGSDRWEVGVYFTEAPDEVALALLAAAHGAQPFVVSELPEVDWVAHVRRELSPVEAGRFFVHGSHDADKVPEGAEALCIEAAMAFGTGHHDTTRGCLLALDRMDKRPQWLDASAYPMRVYFLIGLFQCLAMIPGVSRSGATIAGGRYRLLDECREIDVLRLAEVVHEALRLGRAQSGSTIVLDLTDVARDNAWQVGDLDRVLAEADLTGIADRRVGSCSGGQQQRLRFALAVLADPDLLILDEPTAGMDAAARHDFWRAMHAQAERGRTIVFATHYIEEAQDFADRIVMIGAGRILADGPTDVVRRQVAGATVSAVLPPDLDPRTLPGVLAADRDGARTRLSTADSDALARHLLTATDARELAISPASLEDAFLALTDAGHPSDPHDAATPGKA